MNDSIRSVREPENPRPLDRRVRKTRRALTRALVELILEKRYRAITVQDLLDRADVGRSTFYSHYRGKDDLLLRSFEAMLETLDARLDEDPGLRRLAPVRELFEHVDDFRDFHRALVRARRIDRLFNVGAVAMAAGLSRRILASRPELEGRPQELQAVARASAGALFALLRWWIGQDTPPTPETMDDLYHELLLPGLVQGCRAETGTPGSL